MILPVIMAGGSGSRLWPMSRTQYPKQFLSLAGDSTMLQSTVKRLDGLPCERPMIICNETHRFIAAEQLRAIDALDTILLEPIGRNTAPAIALAALHAVENKDDPVLLVLAADHIIQAVDVFQHVVLEAEQLALAGHMVTFGIVPQRPETGYGYINAGETVTQAGVAAAYRVDRFVEKPDLATAQQYVDSGAYYWNSGMFMFRASRYLEELEKFRPDILAACRASMQSLERDLDFVRLDETAFAQCPDESIDYAVMEKTDAAVVVPLDAGWDDVGAWSALWDIGEKDSAGNVCEGDVWNHDSSNCYLHAEDKMIATVGLRDTVVIETLDGVLVADRHRVQEVKKIVEQLKQAGRSEVSLHRKVYRPWGTYDAIHHSERYQVKHITVKPGAKLSVQKHHHRAEHWVVVSGTALVTINSEEQLLTENQSTYIPLGAVHALENPGKIPLELIEVQSGSYLGEDDIVRLEDRYGRIEK